MFLNAVVFDCSTSLAAARSTLIWAIATSPALTVTVFTSPFSLLIKNAPGLAT